MVVGTLYLMQKGQTSGFSKCSHTVDTVHIGCSRIVVYAGGTLSLIQKGQTSGHSAQWTQKNSGIWRWDIVFGAKRSN